MSGPEITRVGGLQAVQKKILDMFGTPNFSQEQTYIWRFPRVQRQVAYTDSTGVVSIVVVDMAEQDSTSTDNSDADLGF